MSKFIYDHTKETAIRVLHITSVSVVSGSVIYNEEEDIMIRVWNVEAEVKGKTFTLAKNFQFKESALSWMKGLGFLK